MTEPQDDLPPGPYSINPMGGDCFQIIGAANDMPLAVVAGEPLARAIAAIPEMREHNTFLQGRVIAFQNEATRLRADNAELQKQNDDLRGDYPRNIGVEITEEFADNQRLRAEKAEMLQHKDGGDRYEEYIHLRAENEINRLAAQAAANIAREIDAENKRLRMEKAELQAEIDRWDETDPLVNKRLREDLHEILTLRRDKAELIDMLATRTTHPEYVEVLRRYKPENKTEA